MEHLISSMGLWYRRSKGSYSQRTAGGYALQRPKMPNTQEGAERQEMLERLYRWYEKNGCGEDFTDEKWPGQENSYWKNRLRTASTERLEKIYQEKFGGTPCMQ